MHFEMTYAKCRPFFSGFNVLTFKRCSPYIADPVYYSLGVWQSQMMTSLYSSAFRINRRQAII